MGMEGGKRKCGGDRERRNVEGKWNSRTRRKEGKEL